jgi:hypothetical protein
MLGAKGVAEVETAAVEAGIAEELGEAGIADVAEGAATLGAAESISEDD